MTSTSTLSRRGTGGVGPVAISAVVVAGICVLPLLVILATATESGLGVAAQQVFRPRVGELLGNTVSLVLVTTTAAVALAVPAFVNAYAWVSLRPSLTGLGGAALITTLSYTPFVFLPVAALLRGLDSRWEDSARSLGLGAWGTFAKIVLPQVRPALLGGALLVALHLLAEFGVLAMLRFPTFTTAILVVDHGWTVEATFPVAAIIAAACGCSRSGCRWVDGRGSRLSG